MVSNFHESHGFEIALSYLYAKKMNMNVFINMKAVTKKTDNACIEIAHYSPLCCLKNAIVAFKTVDLSNFRLADDTIAFSSLIRMLNWSRRFFSLRFRDFLRMNENNDNFIKRTVC